MSLPHATRPKEGASPRTTRQLLDELDALMDQMLALPVEDEPADEPPPAAGPALSATLTIIEPDLDKTPLAVTTTTPDPPTAFAPRPAQKSRAADVAAPKRRSANRRPVEGNPVVRVEHMPAIPISNEETDSDAPPWTKELVETDSEDSASKPEDTFALVDLDDEAATNALLAVETPKPPVVSPTPRREPARPMPRSSASWAFGTLVVWDRAFRRMTRRLGPFGWLLRTAVGRVILGALGLAFWIVSLVWLVHDWLQWTR